MTSMNEPERWHERADAFIALHELDSKTIERLTKALQDIKEYDFDHDISRIDYICLINIACEALEGE